jgi:hypothetical protein
MSKMPHQDRMRILTSERGSALRQLANAMITDADAVPPASEVKAALEEIFPDDSHAKLRADLTGRLKKVAEAAQDREARFALRGICDELVIKVETKLVEDDRFIPVPEEEEIDAFALADDVHYGSKIGGELDRKRDKERAAELESRRRAGLSTS